MMLAGLIFNGILTIEQAELIHKRLGERAMPDTVRQCVEEIQYEIDIVQDKM